jgi:DNA recombination protein RmuC
MNELLIYLLGGLATGAIVGWLVRGLALKERLASLQGQLSDLDHEHAELQTERARLVEAHRQETERRAQAEERASRLPALEHKLAEQDSLMSRASTKIAELTTLLAEERKSAGEKLALLNEAQQKLADAFKALSADALKSNNQSFLDLAKSALEKFQEGARTDLETRQKAVGELVRPLRESLEKVEGKLGELEIARVHAYSALSEQLKGLVETHLPLLHNETANLVKALRQPTVRGRWGEIQLKRVVEMAGMLDHCDFLEQESREGEDGRLRPDMIVRLPGGKQVVVDAKAPIAAYLEAMDATDEATQQARLADHARQVRNHMTNLGRKAYWEHFDPTPEFVVLFLPGEMFFSAALQQDPGLIEYGVNEKVIPATPTTLIALLRAVSYGWRQEAIARNAQELSDLGKDLYKRLGDLAEHWIGVGKGLDRALDAYNRATGTLESRVLVSARRFRDLGSAPADTVIEVLEPLDHAPRNLQAPELSEKLKEDPENVR